jgi:hypothetical protein
MSLVANDIDSYLETRTSIIDYGQLPNNLLTAHSQTLRECVKLLHELKPLFQHNQCY